MLFEYRNILSTWIATLESQMVKYVKKSQEAKGHSRTPRCFALLAEVLRVEVGRAGVKVFVVVDAGDVDVEHVSLLQCDFRARYPASYTYIPINSE